ncbi:MAG: flagellar hook-length control protein FliK [Sulfuricurvum sp.]|nr:flagellar hook-length control protein FliK [Sulfuricurvum sp.]MDD5387285.1 flagellar hook-length control protein FliK [Sulfuricurvum sp.]
MISTTIQSKLSLLLPNQNKVLTEIIKYASPEQLTHLYEKNDLKTFLGSLFHDTLTDSKSNSILLDILKNNPSFKNMGNVTNNLKTLLASLKEEPALAAKLSKLESFLQPIQTANASLLKEKIADSGIFMESKIATLAEVSSEELEENMGRDVKSNLLILKSALEELSLPNNENLQMHIDQLITNIDYYQLMSHLESANSLYFPFKWDQLQKGTITFKKAKGKKFYCEINLTLKEYGEIALMMGLYEENQLEIQIHTEKTELKTLIQTHLEILRNLLIDTGITLRILRVYENKDLTTPSSTAYTPEIIDKHFGFEAKA